MKRCKVLLVSEDINELNDWIEKIEDVFINIYKYNFRECIFGIDGLKVVDFRVDVEFESEGTKNEIYKKMNEIKSNPIKFIK